LRESRPSTEAKLPRFFWGGAPGAAQSINLDNFGIVTNATLTLP
jgi:hypothetical protein